MNVSYFNGGYKSEKPIDADELDVTWSLLISFGIIALKKSFSFKKI